MWGNPGGWRHTARTRGGPREINSSPPACLLAPIRATMGDEEVQDILYNLQGFFFLSFSTANPPSSGSDLMSGS